MIKSGSTLMTNMLKELLGEVEIPVVNISGTAFAKGIRAEMIDASMGKALKTKGYAYLGFRQCIPEDTQFDLAPVKKILLIRDPRDMTVSLYFSQRESHKIPDGDGTDRIEGLGRTTPPSSELGHWGIRLHE